MTQGVRAFCLLVLVISVQLPVARPPVAIFYDRVAAETAKVMVLEWNDGMTPHEVPATIARESGGIAVAAAPATQAVVLFVRNDGAYAIDGPFPWPSARMQRTAPDVWRHTVSGAVAAGVPPDGAVEWNDAGPDRTPWPRCVRANAVAWQCWGVAPADRGVITIATSDSVWWGAIDGGPAPVLRRGRWARMLIVAGLESGDRPLRVVFGRPVPPPAERLGGLRLDTALVPDTDAVRVTPNTMWVAGAGPPPPKAWADIRSDDYGPVYLPLQDLADGPSGVPVHVRVEPRRAITGTVTGASGQPAPGALVTLFRAIDPPPAAGSTAPPRRVFAGEKTTNGEGGFAIDGLGDADYEIVAWHAQLGRATVALAPSQQTVVIPLRAAGLVRGRVLSAGQPAAGIDIISVPDMAAFNAAKDVTDVKGGDARTGEDGRFIVMVASAGGGELRIGGGRYAVRRVPLPRPAAADLDLGDIDVASAIEVTIVLDRDVGCGVRAVGPIGRTGLQIVSATRAPDGTFTLAVPEPGLWQFGLICPAEKHALSPASLQIQPAHAGKEVRFTVR